MGVTYKLKQEVTDYILALKRDEPSLSCRKVSELASAHFKKAISKSSVNAVLKEGSLSSPVGRRAGKKAKAEKFKIPEHRKEQIFINIPSSLLGAEKPRAPAVPPASSTRFTHAGILLLKAAEWQMKKQGVLRFLAEKFGPVLCEEKILKLSQALLFLPFFGERNSGKFLTFDQKQAWQISGIDFEPTTYQKKECLDVLSGLEEKAGAISLEFGQIFSEVSFFRFIVEDGSSFCIDGQKNSCWAENNVHSDFSVCLDKAFNVLSKDFIINSNPIILREATTSEGFSAHFLNMAASFEHVPGKKIKRIDLMTSQKEALSAFENVVGKTRHYIAGLYNCQGLIDRPFHEHKKEPRHVASKATKQSYYYWEAATAFRLPDGRQVPARMALMSLQKDGEPAFAILTNIPESVQSLDEVAARYLEAWPRPMAGQAYFSQRRKQTLRTCCDIASFPDAEAAGPGAEGLFEDKGFLPGLANALLGGLHDHCARHFFMPEDKALGLAQAAERFYSLSGEIHKEDHIFRVKLTPGPGYRYGRELAFILDRVNESVPCDLKGRRMFME